MCPCFMDKIKDMKMDEMASLIGVSPPVFRFLICFVATIPISFFHRFVPGGSTGKHLYAALTGGVLSYLAFGLSSNMHFLVLIIISYGSMLLSRKQCGFITFVLAMSYLIGIHAYYTSGDSWKEGGIDATGSMMVITLKVISCAINYNDGLLREEGLSESQKKNRLLKLPSFLEFVGYCLSCGIHFAGPVFEMKDYLDWTERKGIWVKSDKPSPSPCGPTIKALLQAGLCMWMYLYLEPRYPVSRLNDPIYRSWPFMERLIYQYMCSFTARWKYYFIWSVSEGSMILSGLGFSGWTNSLTPKPRWDRAENVDILGVEFAKSAVEIPLVWNIHVSSWLRHYVYDRLVQKGKRPGFFQLLATQTVSAIWHNQHVFVPFGFDTFGVLGPDAVRLLKRVQKVVNSNSSTLKAKNIVFSKIGFAIQKGVVAQLVARLPAIGVRPGYIIFFVQSALMISGSKTVYRWQQSVPSSKRGLRKMIMLTNFAYTMLVLSYSSIGFIVLSLNETITSYGSVYYIGTIIPVVFILTGNVIKPKPLTSRARKNK